MHVTIKPIVGATLLVGIIAHPVLAEDRLEIGRKLFSQTAVPACAICHTMRDANAKGAIGPDLDELKPDTSRVEKAVRNGIGQMPAIKNLNDAQIKALSEYVATATSAGK